MKVLWTILKVALGLVILVPAAIIVLSLALGALGTLFGLAVAVLRLAFLGLCVYGVFKLGAMLFGGGSRRREVPLPKQLPPIDPYYEAAKRELDQEMGEAR